MRTLIPLTALVLLFSVSSAPQEVEHAPTAQQCQADQALWMSKLEGDHGLDTVTVRTLHLWEHEMGQCMIVDKQNHSKYYNTDAEAVATESTRELNFIDRHSLLSQFYKEDAEGQR
ncbi:MAG: hypothetical protein ABSB65_09705 [Candidatus Acidiferrales bacterium]